MVRDVSTSAPNFPGIVHLPFELSEPFSPARAQRTWNDATMPPGRKRQTAAPPPSKTLVLDNGAYTIKAGFVTTNCTGDPEATVIPNCIARDRERKVYVASDLERCKDFGEIVLRRPVEKGYIVNWEAQREIWNNEFLDDKSPLACDPAETRLLLA